MASKKQRKRRAKRRAQLPPSRTDRPWRPTPVHAIELKHGDQARRFAARADRFSQLLATLLKDERSGQYLVTTGNLSPEEHAELLSLAEDAHAAFREELAAATQTLRELLALGDPLYIASVVHTLNVWTGRGTYYEPTHSGAENKVELIAGLLASQPVAASLDGPTDAQMQMILDEVDHILDVVLLFNLSMPRGDNHDAATLRFKGAMNWMTVRGSSYGSHGEDLARALYSPHDAWMLEQYGFTVDDVLMLGARASELTVSRLNALISQARAFSEAVIDYASTAEGEANLPKAIVAQVKAEERSSKVGAAAFIYWFQNGVRQATTVSVNELCAKKTGMADDRTIAVLNELSISVGSLEPSAYTGLYDKSPLIERPFLEFNSRYLLAVPGMVRRDTVVLLEERFMRNKPNYARDRAKTLDALAVKYLASMLPGATTYTNLFYDDTELDGLVLFDDMAFVVEGKGTSLSVQSHRGDIQRLARDIRDAVEQAWQQGARARAFILGDGDSVFRDAAGNEVVRITPGSINDVVIVNPTLHELGGHAPQLAQLRSLGLFPDDELPWSIYINDLRVIAETCDNAAVFLHYLVWRGRLPLGERVMVSDELDLWGAYLLSERFGVLADNDILVIGSFTTDFDEYYDGVLGHGPKKDRPSKFLKEPVKAFVDRMATERPRGWRVAAGACLDLSIPELAFVCQKAKDAGRNASREGMPVWIQCGRVALVGVPEDMEVTPANEFVPDGTAPTIIVYSRQAEPRKPAIIWARYAKPVTFELSEYEKAAFNAPTTSPFTFEHRR